MAQGEYIELHRKRHGRRLDYEERKRKAGGLKRRGSGLVKTYNRESLRREVQLSQTAIKLAGSTRRWSPL